MCEQCIVNPLSFGEVLPGIYLMRARRDGNEMNAGDWGLVYCNGPFFVWSGTREKHKIFEKPRTYTGKYAQLVELTLSDEFYDHDKISLEAYKWDGTFIEVADWWALLKAIGYDYKKQRYV